MLNVIDWINQVVSTIRFRAANAPDPNLEYAERMKSVAVYARIPSPEHWWAAYPLSWQEITDSKCVVCGLEIGYDKLAECTEEGWKHSPCEVQA